MTIARTGEPRCRQCGSGALVRVVMRPREGSPVAVLVCASCGARRRAQTTNRETDDPWWAR